MKKNQHLIHTVAVMLLFLVIVCVGIRWFWMIQRNYGVSAQTLYQLTIDGEAIVKSTNGSTNILLLGIGGQGHEGYDLTDTILVISFNIKQKTVSMISIPRDIWSDELQDKINSAYHYGQENGQNSGLDKASMIIHDLTGLPIHYGAVVDFSQFAAFINVIGGIDVGITQSFTDEAYPIAGKENDMCDGDWSLSCRYQTVHFEKGIEHMDGARALIYVRSRHAEGEAGSDFSRGRRQMEVVEAVKTKIWSLQPWFHPEIVFQMVELFGNTVQTNFSTKEILALGKLSFGIDSHSLKQITIDEQLIEAPYEWYGRYTLIPNNQETLKEYIQSSLK